MKKPVCTIKLRKDDKGDPCGYDVWRDGRRIAIIPDGYGEVSKQWQDAQAVTLAMNSHQIMVDVLEAVAMCARVGHDKPKDYGVLVKPALLAAGKEVS